MPLAEDALLGPINPYGRTKLMVEQILRDVAVSNPGWRVFLLRYFNPVGAHDSGLIGEDPIGTPNNLMPFVAQVAVGRRPRLSIYGGDYPTIDGTGVRDYIHVVDLAAGHVAALAKLAEDGPGHVDAVNLGTGCPHSVLQVVKSFEAASGRPIPYDIVDRRAGGCRNLLCRSDPRVALAGMEGPARPRRDVRGRMALAIGESGGSSRWP